MQFDSHSLKSAFSYLNSLLKESLKAAGVASWSAQRYKLVDGGQGKAGSSCYSRLTRKTWTIAGLTLILLLASCGIVLSVSLQGISDGPYDVLEERACHHPVARLVSHARKSFQETLERQSSTLDEAVAEYQRRYKMPPPPHFDEWYRFATERQTVLIDEFDTIYHSILPFWGLSPSVIRTRVREDVGPVNETYVMGLTVRNGTIDTFGKHQGDFQERGTRKIIKKFQKWLPALTLQFNAHDEPRVALAHEQLSRLVKEGRAAQARLNSKSAVSNTFSPGDWESPSRPAPGTYSRWNSFVQQETWLYSRLSCPPETAAMALDGNASDDTAAYAVDPLGFIFNQSAASDVCNTPSLRHRLGLFQRPNAFKVSNELTPMFSMSHPSSFQDIPVPSPFYYEDMSKFDPDSAVTWEEKHPQLYWRGRTTGGHSLKGSWRQLQRQRIIGNLTHPQSAHHIMSLETGSQCTSRRKAKWSIQEADQAKTQEHFNIHFTDIIDCDDDCDEEKAFFNDVAQPEPQEMAWNYRYLLDLDGYAYSGRFYAFLRSKSVPFKITSFREWDQNILFPWVHYVPVNMEVQEVPELIRFFEDDEVGREIAKTIGEDGQSWAARALRNDDMEVYMFRLLLEYARVQDDRRESLGFVPESQ
ncbi:hypothetical protein POX_a00636 [Penicillium oxalicum]|uniref:Putative UDP-Xyl: (Mannosyl) glucuronoxylomannan/galactoxylomannan beta-1,2-xylosyltransferase n=1 Tax=Penicillium oxalicum (strain 114-2 / CGMCC 5302) TaxID=933388 RepID=S7ZUL2_PENO1|nr:hypothetical protein POX_a00636 [Penicillium oxalicum]EPS34390.1 putative UDP-Xyl: (mannosyl) glucuronoxylomannan/galactoxylomannan beta-1,2-xylosyltransferase [Penicillium oxalicum 114-2]KAI2794046.1 hypothetical protein POX_a00636 [Penicillium oxalicum]